MVIAWIKAVVGITAILFGWLAVQQTWRTSAQLGADEDALSGRLGCHGCDCHAPCDNKNRMSNSLSDDQEQVVPPDQSGAI